MQKKGKKFFNQGNYFSNVKKNLRPVNKKIVIKEFFLIRTKKDSLTFFESTKKIETKQFSFNV